MIILSTSSATVEWVVLASFFMGIFGSFTSVITGVMAYIGTITDRDDRLVRVSIIESMALIAGTVGPSLAGAIAKHSSLMIVFVTKAVVHVLAILYVVFVVKDVSDPNRKRPELSIAGVFSLGHLKDSFDTCFRNTSPERFRTIVSLFAMACFFMVVSSGMSI